jgi:hypothetical protein
MNRNALCRVRVQGEGGTLGAGRADGPERAGLTFSRVYRSPGVGVARLSLHARRRGETLEEERLSYLESPHRAPFHKHGMRIWSSC